MKNRSFYMTISLKNIFIVSIISIICIVAIIFYTKYKSSDYFSISENTNVNILENTSVNKNYDGYGEKNKQNYVNSGDTSNSNIDDEKKTILEDFKGFKTVGKICIPKIKLDTYILENTTDKSLEISVTKLCGPMINTQGNFCISGHNYKKDTMFGNLYKLEIGDIIYIYDKYGKKMDYKIYDIYTTNPKDVKCLEYNNSGNTEITLITCTTLSLKRLIIKAENVYDY